MPPSESNVLVRLRLLGGALFDREAKSAGRSLGRVGVGAKEAEAGLLGTSHGANRATGALGRMEAATGATMGVLRGIGMVAAPVAGFAMFEAGKKAMDFQQAMEMVHTQAGASQREVKVLSGSVLDLSKHMSQSPQQLAQGLFHLESIGLRGSKAMDALKVAAQGAAVGNADLEDTTTALGSAWLVGIKGAGNLHHVMGILNATVGAGNVRMGELVQGLGTGILPAAKTAGLGIQDVMGALAVFTDEGYNASSASAQLGTALHFLYNPTTKASTAMKGIGLSNDSLAKDMRKPQGLLTALTDLHNHLGRLSGGAKGVKAEQVLGQILPGGRGRILLTLINQLDRYQRKLHQVGSTAGKFGEAWRRTQETAAFKVHAAWSTVQAALIRMGAVLLPAVGPALNGMIGLAGAVSRAFRPLAKDISRVAGAWAAGQQGSGQGYTGIAGRVAAVSRAVPHAHLGAARKGFQAGLSGKSAAETAGFAGISGVAVKVGHGLRGLAAGAKKYGGQFLAAFKPAMPFFQNVLLPLIQGVVKGVLGAIIGAIPVIKVLATVLGFVGKVLRPLRGVFQIIGVVIGVVFSGAILKALEALGKLGLVFRLLGAPLRIADRMISLMARPVVLLARVVGRLGGAFMRGFTMVQRFAGTLSGGARRVAVGATNIVGGVIHAVETLPGRVLKFALGIGEKLVHGMADGTRSKLGGLLSFFGRVGKVIVDAVVKAIKGAPAAISGAVMSLVPGPVKGAAKKVLGLAGKVGLATGGHVRSGGWAVVGERGPELTHLPGGSTVYSHRESRRAPIMAAPSFGPLYAQLLVNLDGKVVHSAVHKVERAKVERR